MIYVTKQTIKYIASKFNESLVNQGVKWTFNPPCAPYFGSVLEMMIKSIIIGHCRCHLFKSKKEIVLTKNKLTVYYVYKNQVPIS